MKLTNAHIELRKRIHKRGIGRICNDLLPEEKQLLTNKQWQELAKAYHKWNGDPEEYDPSHPVMLDFMVVNFLDNMAYEELNKSIDNLINETGWDDE